MISPLLSNIYLHEVLDRWFEEDVKPRLRGRSFLVRYADDAVLGFGTWDDARRVLNVLPRRFGKFGLTLHPEKTRMVKFRPAKRPKNGRKARKTGTFDFLGFTHCWGKGRSRRYAIRRRTAQDRFTRSKAGFSDFCRRARHLPLLEQHRTLCAKLRGHYAYFGVCGNWDRLWGLYREVIRIWQKWLSRRSQRRSLTWAKFLGFLNRFPLPQPRIVHGNV